MPKQHITKSAVEAAEPQASEYVIHDHKLSGFQLRVTPAGKKVFYLYYRTKGARMVQRRYKLGDFPSLSAVRARELAVTKLGEIAAGGDPAAERRAERNKLNSDRTADIVARFLDEHVSQNRSARETTRIFNRYVLPKFGKRSIHSITRADVNDLLGEVRAQAPTMANRLLAAIRKFFNWCHSRAIIEKTPTEGVGAPAKENQRDRVLSDDELKRVLNACRATGYPYGAIVSFLAITGQRREEVSAAVWTEFNLDKRIWTIPAARSKNGKAHVVHLSDTALAILDKCPRIGAPVFSTNGEKPFNGFSKSKVRLDLLSGVTDWRLHDLRRTVVSGMAELGVPPHIADKVLNHQTGTISGVAAVYQKSEFLKERRDALDLWSDHIDALLSAQSDTKQETA